jgi:hypothetical protein
LICCWSAGDADGVMWDKQVQALVAATTAWTGNDTRPVDYTVSKLHAARAEPVLQDVVREALTVAGTRAWLVRQLKPRVSRRG